MTSEAVVLVAHGTVDSLDDLPEFLTNIRRGHPAPAELLAEVRRRYEAIGGQSPLNAINRELARKLEARLGLPVRLSNRLFAPYPRDVLGALAASGVTRVRVVPLAQHSAHVYGEAVREAARDRGIEVTAAPNWGRTPALTDAFARAIVASVREGAGEGGAALLMTAHSLPMSVVEAGDPYEEEFRASAEDVAARARALAPGVIVAHAVAFQSQGMSTGAGGRPMPWLGPDLRHQMEELAAHGHRTVVVAPIGFLADHVEILYDLDIEARAWADELGIALRRTRSLNASDALVDVLAVVAKALEPKEGATSV
ncbi:MAG: ferrochelatase [Labilithrix sp.]|nr:ferrochelatase [Labilithrix sp.]